MSFSAMFIASTGMQALGTGMGTISNNLANVNTVGYKTMRTNYQDLIYESYFSSGHNNLVGKGSRVATLQTIFNQGAFKSTGGDTDLAIAGEGFFSVRHNQTGEILYTRAGAYTFDKDGYLQDQSGNTLQGWKLSTPEAGGTATRMGGPVDIQINQLTVPPVATTSIKLAVNLNAADVSKYYYPPTLDGSADQEGDGFAGAWDATARPPISPDSYSHSEDLTVYDQDGNRHTLMVYYQKNPHMENVWDYIVTADPAEEGRSSLADSSYAGLIQKGKITFTADSEETGHGGLIKSLEAQNLSAGTSGASWTDVSPSAGGDLSLSLNFLNQGTGSSLSQSVALNMGKIFDPAVDQDADWATTTQYGSTSSITLKEQNGYPAGSLQRVSVGEDGKIVGVYSHGREVELYQISLTRFMSPWGLDKRGDNLFAETRYSGDARTLAPGEGGAGDIVGNFLEQSTVDTATEIVQMILTQRGFQANSKAITTNDTMIATAIQTKR